MTEKSPPDMKLRLTAEMRKQIEEAAELNNRTMTGEIIARLQWSFDQEAQQQEASPAPSFAWAKKARQDNFTKLEGRIEALEDEIATLKKRLKG